MEMQTNIFVFGLDSSKNVLKIVLVPKRGLLYTFNVLMGKKKIYNCS